MVPETTFFKYIFLFLKYIFSVLHFEFYSEKQHQPSLQGCKKRSFECYSILYIAENAELAKTQFQPFRLVLGVLDHFGLPFGRNSIVNAELAVLVSQQSCYRFWTIILYIAVNAELAKTQFQPPFLNSIQEKQHRRCRTCSSSFTAKLFSVSDHF